MLSSRKGEVKGEMLMALTDAGGKFLFTLFQFYFHYEKQEGDSVPLIWQEMPLMNLGNALPRDARASGRRQGCWAQQSRLARGWMVWLGEAVCLAGLQPDCPLLGEGLGRSSGELGFCFVFIVRSRKK